MSYAILDNKTAIEMLRSQVIVHPQPGAPSMVVTPIEQNTQVPTASGPVYNTLPVGQSPVMETETPAIDAPAADNNKNLLLIGGVGLAAVLLKQKKKKVSGKKNMLVPVLIIGAAAAWYFFIRKKDSVTEMPGNPYIDDQTYQDNVNNNVPSPVIDINPDAAAKIRSQTAMNNEAWMRYAYPQYIPYMDQLTDAQINTLYQFLYGYVAQGLKLYRLPGSTGIYADGGYNTVLYDAVKALPFREQYLSLHLG